VWGAIHYKGEGIFIAGGAGITPFIAILKQLAHDRKLGNNKLIFSNKTSQDVILEKEFEQMLGKNFIKVITTENIAGVRNKRIDKDYLKEVITNFDQHFYVCGPEKFTEGICASLAELGAKPDALVFEK
jgi:ferredoxin-NADP reductase